MHYESNQFRKGELLRMHYVDAAGCPSFRLVKPIGLVRHRNKWLLQAEDQTVGAFRTFRLDRVIASQPVERLGLVRRILALVGR